MKLTELPYTVFLELLSYIPPIDIVVCRRLSSDVRRALVRNDLCTSLIAIHFPRSLEGRALKRHIQEDYQDSLDSEDWASIFTQLASRYFHLGNATPRRTQKITLLDDGNGHLCRVEQWDRHLQLNDKHASFHYQEPLWTCDPKAGLLVYPSSETDERGEPKFWIRDLATGVGITVPFDLDDRAVRRIRLSHGVLLFEWCEIQYDVQSRARRHFATAYTVAKAQDRAGAVREGQERKPMSAWTITLCSEWMTHPDGLHSPYEDFFYSAHNSTHYVVYTWQKFGQGDEPSEALVVWDMGRPSSTTTGAGKPCVIHEMGITDLDAWVIRQRNTPTLNGLRIDDCTWDERSQSPCGHFYFLEEDHRWSVGEHTGREKPRLHRVRSTGVPLLGNGPRWVDDCGGSGNDGSMNFCRRGAARRGRMSVSPLGDPDPDLSETWPGRAPCWRHDDFPYLTVAEVFDVAAGVRISARQCFMLETLSVHIRPKLCVRGVHTTTTSAQDDLESIVSSSSSDSGDAPDGPSPFPLSGHGQNKRRKRGRRANGPDGVEVQFEDGMWSELLGKGYLCGDERWLVGEDRSGKVTVVYF